MRGNKDVDMQSEMKSDLIKNGAFVKMKEMVIQLLNQQKGIPIPRDPLLGFLVPK